MHELEGMLGGEFALLFSLTGEDGVQTATRAQPDVVLLDMVLPDIPGWRVIDMLRADPATAHTPIIGMSASSQVVEVGTSGFIMKPFEADEVLAAVRGVL